MSKVHKLWAVVMAAALVVSMLGLQPSARADGTSSAVFMGQDMATDGNWVGVYGGDGYVLPFYSAQAANGRDPGWPTVRPADAMQLPGYVSAYSKSTNSGYYVNQNPTTNRLGLVSPDQTTRKLMEAGAVEYTFTVSSQQPFLFTVYSYGPGTSVINEKLDITDLSNNVLASRTVNTTNNNHGIYSQFMIRGSFKLRMAATSGGYHQTQGLFFDAVPASTVSATSAVYEVPRKVKLEWTNGNTANQVSIARKKQQDSLYQEIAIVSGSQTQYVDANLDAGSTYQYVLRSIANHKYAANSAPLSVTLPDYEPTAVTMASYSYTVAGPGSSLEMTATLTDANRQPIAGKTITFELSGPYVGSYIGKNLGSAVTDSLGVASVVYTFAYAGSYQVAAIFLPDDANLLDGSRQQVPLTVQTEAWTQPPKLIHVTDAAKPGDAVSVNGYAIDAAQVQAAIAPAGQTGATPLTGTPLQVLQTDDKGVFAVAKLPDNLTPGVYRLWVKNAYGWSDPIMLNAPRPQFISEYEAYAGLSIKLAGRNLDGTEFGAARQTQVRLSGVTGGVYTQTVTGVNPFAVDFTIGSVPLGDYFVDVSNDGGTTWIRLDNGQKLTIVTPGPDPLGLGVAWARDFNWANEVNVLDYGAVADDRTDDTAAIQAAIAAAKAGGGGVVVFPNGTYRATHIGLPANIVLKGENRSLTRLMFTGTDSSKNFIDSIDDGTTVGKQGIAQLTLTIDESNGIFPGFFMWFGHDWGKSYNMTERTASEFFLHDFGVDYPLDHTGFTGLGNTMAFIADKRLLITDSVLRGYGATMNVNYLTKYYTIANNRFEFTKGTGGGAQGYAVFENNQIIGHPEYDQYLHGPFIGNHSYVHNNLIVNVGTPSNNDGEVFSTDGSGFWTYGEVLGATATTVDYAPAKEPIAIGPLRATDALVVIVDGRGMGQYRTFAGIAGNRITVDKPWDIVPDRTSKVTVINSNANVTIYENVAKNASGPFQFYGHAVDGVMKDNVGVDTNGLEVVAHGEPRVDPRYYIRLDGNTMRGDALRRIYDRIHVTSGGQYATLSYGIDIRNNVLIGQGDSTSPVGIFADMGSTSSLTESKALKNFVVQRNVIMDYTTGVQIGKGVSGALIYRNMTRGVGSLVTDSGSVNAIQLENE